MLCFSRFVFEYLIVFVLTLDKAMFALCCQISLPSLIWLLRVWVTSHLLPFFMPYVSYCLHLLVPFSLVPSLLKAYEKVLLLVIDKCHSAKCSLRFYYFSLCS